jgi:PPOX class probable F420-dependent enzyme
MRPVKTRPIRYLNPRSARCFGGSRNYRLTLARAPLYVAASMPRRYTKAEVDKFLRRRRMAVLGTNSANGAPVLTPIWYLYRDGRILMRTDKQSVKARNIERDPRVTVCVQDERPPYASVTVYGKAAIEPPHEGLGAALAKHYLGALGAQGYERAAREEIERGDEITLVITPERALTQDFSPETPWYGKLWLLLKRVLPPQL